MTALSLPPDTVYLVILALACEVGAVGVMWGLIFLLVWLRAWRWRNEQRRTRSMSTPHTSDPMRHRVSCQRCGAHRDQAIKTWCSVCRYEAYVDVQPTPGDLAAGTPITRTVYLRSLLKALEARIPPARHPDAIAAGHHAITFCQYGSAETGWTDQLGLHLRLTPAWNQVVFLDDTDLEKPIDQLVDEIVMLLPFSTVGQPTADRGTCDVPPNGWRCTREPGHDGPCAAVPMAYSLEQYIRSQYAPELGRIDFSFRALVTPEAVEIYVHPHGQAGETTPTLIVEGDRVRTKP